jgi:hypothetical protein
MTTRPRLLVFPIVCSLFFATPAAATLRGVWDYITNGTAFNAGLPNGCEQPALRPGVTFSTGGHSTVETWFAFTTRSGVIGRETARSIWIARNQDQIGFRVTDILQARRPLVLDPTAGVSYADPAWSPNGRYLAYVKTDAFLSRTAIYVQEFRLGDDIATAATPVGAPLLVVPADPSVMNRNPAWSPEGDALAYTSTAAGPSQDIWTIPVDPASRAVGTPVRATLDDARAESNPSWGPGNRIVYITNRYGRGVLEIVDLDDHGTRLAETNFSDVSHRNPSFAPDGDHIYYEAAEDEDPDRNPDIWVLDLATQSKCDIHLDASGDADPDVSRLTNFTAEGLPYHLFLTTSQAGAFGVCVWRGSAVGCLPPLPIGVAINPATLNPGSQGKSVVVTVTMPPETRALGYRARVDVPDHGAGIPAGFEGVKNRNTILGSPTFLGLTAPTSDINGSPYAAVDNGSKRGEEYFQINMDRKEVEARLVALGLVDQFVPCRVTAYSNLKGRQFTGYGYVKIASNNKSGQVVRVQQNAPNPFNPSTRIPFSLARAGEATVRIYDVRGACVATVARGYFEAGSHVAVWNGATARGRAPSGVYFAKAAATGAGGEEVAGDVVKMVLAK